MKKVFLLLFIILFYSCSADDEGVYFNEETPKIEDINLTYSEIELEILNLINEYRNSIGLQTLKTLNIVSKEAISHTEYMIKNGTVSHDNFAERHSNLVEKALSKSTGENVAYGYSTAKGVLSAWLESESHRKIIESNSFTDFGVSAKKNDKGRLYFTNIFIKR